MRVTAEFFSLLGVAPIAGSRILSGLLFGISPASPLPYAIALLLLGFVGMFACYVPARRAVRVDPITVLRYE